MPYERKVQLISRPGYMSEARRAGLSGVTGVISNIYSFGVERERTRGELAEHQKMQQYGQPNGGMPSWLIPAALVGGVGLFLVLRKK